MSADFERKKAYIMLKGACIIVFENDGFTLMIEVMA